MKISQQQLTYLSVGAVLLIAGVITIAQDSHRTYGWAFIASGCAFLVFSTSKSTKK